MGIVWTLDKTVQECETVGRMSITNLIQHVQEAFLTFLFQPYYNDDMKERLRWVALAVRP